VVLVGNKADVGSEDDEKRMATKTAADMFATQNQLVGLVYQ
jgi:hypothetical protein